MNYEHDQEMRDAVVKYISLLTTRAMSANADRSTSVATLLTALAAYDTANNDQHQHEDTATLPQPKP